MRSSGLLAACDSRMSLDAVRFAQLQDSSRWTSARGGVLGLPQPEKDVPRKATSKPFRRKSTRYKLRALRFGLSLEPVMPAAMSRCAVRGFSRQLDNGYQ